ncbi:unnamed protein product [Ceratitis capitata]|uniref:(Mediterranean fruit fly) hypothetical protein n=1 Tax=Ceratitis capitata TaxID=7213 RepID=A0A811UJ47_CERCA|nr:unnamed protein product [Ceratitis capitata]
MKLLAQKKSCNQLKEIAPLYHTTRHYQRQQQRATTIAVPSSVHHLHSPPLPPPSTSSTHLPVTDAKTHPLNVTVGRKVDSYSNSCNKPTTKQQPQQQVQLYVFDAFVVSECTLHSIDWRCSQKLLRHFIDNNNTTNRVKPKICEFKNHCRKLLH